MSHGLTPVNFFLRFIALFRFPECLQFRRVQMCPFEHRDLRANEHLLLRILQGASLLLLLLGDELG